ncbi:MAG TPA: hypothetical protein VMF08_15895 [Candidatus Sulfotelmatobacter sp.]|nr:hypothetical protein [Candidatus Sulfotelmatobacter sp.]
MIDQIEDSEPASTLTSTETGTETVTVAFVERISHRVAMGIPLDLALAGESVTEENYKEHLEADPELARIEGAARCRFVEQAIAALLAVENPSTNIRWLLERLYPEEFCLRRAADDAEKEKPRQTILGVPEEFTEQMRAEALAREREWWASRQ